MNAPVDVKAMYRAELMRGLAVLLATHDIEVYKVEGDDRTYIKSWPRDTSPTDRRHLTGALKFESAIERAIRKHTTFFDK
jgi:hypothetical protein